MSHNADPIMNDATRNTPAPHTAHVISLTELQEHNESGREQVLTDRSNPLHQIKARLQVCVGEVTVTVGELLAAREHQVFVLDRAIDHPVEMLLEGKVVARGQLVAVDDQFALRITELPVPLKP
jgi:flagellar motor switch protein FliN/FliY